MEGIEIRGLTKRYKDTTAVDHLTLSIAPGELFALLGVNGAGKTTTIKMLSCIVEPSEGDATLNGESILGAARKVKEQIAISPQETSVAAKLSVRENLEFIARIHGFSKEKTEEKVHEMEECFRLTEVMKKAAGKLSGGWQRKVSIAMALITEPRFLFLDEPTLGLDVLSRYDLWDIIRTLKGTVTVILTTHYMEEAEALSDRIGIMRGGKLITVGTAEEIKRETGCEKFEDAFIQIVRRGKSAR